MKKLILDKVRQGTVRKTYRIISYFFDYLTNTKIIIAIQTIIIIIIIFCSNRSNSSLSSSFSYSVPLYQNSLLIERVISGYSVDDSHLLNCNEEFGDSQKIIFAKSNNTPTPIIPGIANGFLIDPPVRPSVRGKALPRAKNPKFHIHRGTKGTPLTGGKGADFKMSKSKTVLVTMLLLVQIVETIMVMVAIKKTMTLIIIMRFHKTL